MLTGTEERTCRALALRAAVQALALSTDELDLAPEPEEDVLELHSLSDHGGAPVWLGVARCSSGRWPVLSEHNELLTEAVQSLELRRNQEPNFSSQDLYAAVSTVLDHDSCLEVAARLHGPDCKQWFQFWSIDVAPGPLRAALERQGGVVRALGAGSNSTLRERAARATLALALCDEQYYIENIPGLVRAHSKEWKQLTDVVKWYGEGACQADPDEADSPIEAHDDYPIQRTLPLEDIDRGYKGYKGKGTVDKGYKRDDRPTWRGGPPWRVTGGKGFTKGFTIEKGLYCKGKVDKSTALNHDSDDDSDDDEDNVLVDWKDHQSKKGKSGMGGKGGKTAKKGAKSGKGGKTTKKGAKSGSRDGPYTYSETVYTRNFGALE